jgi:cob(I)alamin adenosyltransferase
MEIKDSKVKKGSGDKGLTSLLPGSQVSKADERVGAISGIDEIVAALGSVRVVTDCPIFGGKLTRVQKTLRTLAAGLKDPRSGRFVFSSEEVAFLESDMEKMLGKLEDSDWQSALPGGCEQSARLDVARAVTRRAEHALITMDRRYAVPDTFKQYINRLSDWLQVAARYADQRHNEQSHSAVAETPVPAEAAPAPVAPAVTPTLPDVTSPTAQDMVSQVLARLGMGQALDLWSTGRATQLLCMSWTGRSS